MQSTDHRNSGQLYTTLFGTVAAALGMIVIVTVSLRLTDALRPQNGDIIIFVPANGDSVIDATPVAERVGRSPGAFCILDPNVMERSGGSLIIEATKPGDTRGYRVHWAGGRTSSSGGDCGGSADLLLTPDDTSILLLAANTERRSTDYDKPQAGESAR